MRKRTSLNLDVELLRGAQEALGTSGATETTHRALAEVVSRRKREQLAAYGFPDPTPEFVEETRQDRRFADGGRLQQP